MDALQIDAIVQANNGRAHLTNQVGAGSSEYVVFGRGTTNDLRYLGGCQHHHSRQSLFDDQWKCTGRGGAIHVNYVLDSLVRLSWLVMSENAI